jgi:hypothetical protein
MDAQPWIDGADETAKPGSSLFNDQACCGTDAEQITHQGSFVIQTQARRVELTELKPVIELWVFSIQENIAGLGHVLSPLRSFLFYFHPISMSQEKFAPGHQAILKPGKSKAYSDFFEIHEKPRLFQI